MDNILLWDLLSERSNLGQVTWDRGLHPDSELSKFQSPALPPSVAMGKLLNTPAP